MDAKGGKMFLQDSDSGDDSEVDENDEAARLIKHRGEEEALPISSTTEPTVSIALAMCYESTNC